MANKITKILEDIPAITIRNISIPADFKAKLSCALSFPIEGGVGIVRGLENSPQNLLAGFWKMTKIVQKRQWFVVTNLYQSNIAKSI